MLSSALDIIGFFGLSFDTGRSSLLSCNDPKVVLDAGFTFLFATGAEVDVL